MRAAPPAAAPDAYRRSFMRRPAREQGVYGKGESRVRRMAAVEAPASQPKLHPLSSLSTGELALRDSIHHDTNAAWPRHEAPRSEPAESRSQGGTELFREHMGSGGEGG